MDLPLHQAALLGAIQGLSEFLPISSDGHLALGQALFGISDNNLALSVTLHLGTLLATALFFRQQVAQLPAQVAPMLRSLGQPRRLLETDLGIMFVASLPTAVIGLLLKHSIEEWTRSPFAVSLGFMLTAAALASTARVRTGKRERPTLKQALLIGMVQGFAAAPGLSRSATTIAVALHSGIKPARAFELSMLISLPAVAGAVLLETPELAAGDGQHGISFAALALGVVVAFGVGLLALRWLKRWVSQGRFALFTAWVVPMALLALISARHWPAAN